MASRCFLLVGDGGSTEVGLRALSLTIALAPNATAAKPNSRIDPNTAGDMCVGGRRVKAIPIRPTPTLIHPTRDDALESFNSGAFLGPVPEVPVCHALLAHGSGV